MAGWAVVQVRDSADQYQFSRYDKLALRPSSKVLFQKFDKPPPPWNNFLSGDYGRAMVVSAPAVFWFLYKCISTSCGEQILDGALTRIDFKWNFLTQKFNSCWVNFEALSLSKG